MEIRKEKVKKFSDDYLKKRIHKIYLIIALVFGIGMSVALPVFNEPDGQYHYVASTNIAGLTNDITSYGESATWYSAVGGASTKSYQSGNYFKKYFLVKVRHINMRDLPRLQFLPHKYTYDYLSHLIPALGVWLGYHIYPSMGVMITVGRLVSMFICSLAMFFIIRYVKRGKILFATLSLSPVVMNSFSSLSYDATSYVLAAAVIALTVNSIEEKKITWQMLLKMALLALFSFFAMKTNLRLLLLLFPLVLISKLWQTMKKPKWLESKKVIAGIVSLVLILGFLAFFVLSRRYGGFQSVVYRFFINSTFNFNVTPFDSRSLLADPEGGLMPIWLTGLWFILVFAASLLEEKFVESRLMSYGAFLILLMNALAVFLSFMTFSGALERSGVMGFISGVQGRYFNVFLLLLTIIFANKHWKLKLNSYRGVTFLMIALAIFSNFAWIFNNLFNLIYMS